MGRFAQIFSEIITYLPKKEISENQEICLDLYQNWKIVAAKSKSLFFGCGMGDRVKTFYLEIFQNGRILWFA